MAWIPKDAGNVSLRFWHFDVIVSISADISGALSCSESPVESHPKGVLLDLDSMAGKATEH